MLDTAISIAAEGSVAVMVIRPHPLRMATLREAGGKGLMISESRMEAHHVNGGSVVFVDDLMKAAGLTVRGVFTVPGGLDA